MKQNNGTGFYLFRYAVNNLLRSGVFPVKRINKRYKINIWALLGIFCKSADAAVIVLFLFSRFNVQRFILFLFLLLRGFAGRLPFVKLLVNFADPPVRDPVVLRSSVRIMYNLTFQRQPYHPRIIFMSIWLYIFPINLIRLCFGKDAMIDAEEYCH